jgi:hypothetical protein
MMGMRGGSGAGMMGMMGGSGSGAGMMGMRGGSGAGMMGMMGGSGSGAGMMGMRGGTGMMMMGGMVGGMFGMGAPDVDDVPYFVVAVVEVDPRKANLVKQLTPSQLNPTPFAKVRHKWGESTLLEKTSFARTEVITEDKNNKPLPTVAKRFQSKWDETFVSHQPSASECVELAEWALEHGLVDKFPQVMDKLVQIDKEHPTAIAYLKVKAALEKPATRDDDAANVRNRLLNKAYKADEGPHYTIVHNAGDNDVKRHLELLENAYRGFYYWFTLKGVALSVPSSRQLVVMTGNEKDFKDFHKILSAGPIVVDGFFARNEKLAVMASRRQDETYETLSKFWKNWESKGFRRTDILSGKKGAGVPREVAADTGIVAEAQMVVLMLNALEQEAELATISHDASRQLLFASGLLRRNVAAPEWILFGMGSFFETPLQSPWAGIGAPSPYYLPRWQDLKGSKGLEKEAGQTLRKVVTDSYFRNLPAEGEADSLARHLFDSAQRKARTTAWALTYFLAKKPEYFEGLQRYFKELGKMPRDVELSEDVLLGCFARAFGKVDDKTNKPDKGKLDAMAREWYAFMDNVHFDAESTMKKIRKIFKEKLEQAQGKVNDNGGRGAVDPITGLPIQAGGNLPGIFQPGGGVQPPASGAQPPTGRGGPQPPAGGGARPPTGGSNRPGG